jgi:hypothetical protein
MKNGNSMETEDFLGTFSLKTAPTGLKEKILDGVLQKQKSDHGMTVFLRKGFAVCLLMSIFAIAVDAAITQAQNRRFSSLLDRQQKSIGNGEKEWSMLKDIIWEPLDSTKSVVRGKFYGTYIKTEKKKRRLPEWRESFEKEFE